MPVLFGKVTLKVAPIMKDAGNLDYAIGAAAIQKEMARFLHAWAAYPAPAELPLIIGIDIANGLLEEGFVAQSRRRPEFPEAPFHDGGDVAPGRAGDMNLKAGLLSHACALPRVRMKPLRGFAL